MEKNAKSRESTLAVRIQNWNEKRSIDRYALRSTELTSESSARARERRVKRRKTCPVVTRTDDSPCFSRSLASDTKGLRRGEGAERRGGDEEEETAAPSSSPLLCFSHLLPYTFSDRIRVGRNSTWGGGSLSLAFENKRNKKYLTSYEKKAIWKASIFSMMGSRAGRREK